MQRILIAGPEYKKAIAGPKPATLATVVGVLVEVPVMLTLVKIATSKRHWYAKI